MAVRNIDFALILVVGSFVVIGNLAEISAQTTCGGDLQIVFSKCGRFFKKDGPEILPSQGCCNVLKNLDIPCLCKYITSEVEKLISVEKAIHAAKFCGCSVPAGLKCGSYTVPPPESSPVPETEEYLMSTDMTIHK